MSRVTDMTTGSTTKHIIKFAVPLLLTNIGQQLYTIADAAIVGRGVGVKALAAVGATDWSYWLILWAISGLTQGFSTFVARYFGDKNYKDMNKTIAMSVTLCGVIGTLLTVGGLFAARPILSLLNTPTDIIGDAAVYLMIMICGTLVVMAYNISASILRAFGDGRSPLIAMVIAAVLNIGLDALFVFVFGWGIFGAALASVIAQLVSFLYCLVILRKIDCVCLTKEDFRPDRSLIRSMIFFGVPVAMQNVIIALGGIILQSSINLQGSVFIAGYTATNKAYGLLESSAVSLGYSCSTFLGQNFGAGNYARVRHGLWITVKIVLVMAVAVIALTLLFREYLLQLFLDVGETGGFAALAIGVRYLTIMICFLPILYLIHVFRNALQAIGIAKWSFVSGIAEFAARVFMSKVMIDFIGSDSLFIAEPVAWFGALLSVMLPYFYYRKKLL